MTDKATPRPWTFNDDPNEFAAFRVNGPGGEIIADPYNPGDNRHASEAEANAALIVRAVNAHDELIAALERLKNAVIERETMHDNESDYMDAAREIDAAVDNADTALAKAKGEA